MELPRGVCGLARASGLLTALLLPRTGVAQPRIENAVVHDAIEAFLTDLHERGWFDGALVAGRGDTVIYSRGFGMANVAEGVAFTPATASDTGSLAKTLTAASILLLSAEGRLTLDDLVQTYLAAYPYEGTAVRHLITHTAGALPDYDFYWAQIGPDELLTNERLLAVLASERPAFPGRPGEAFSYSSPAFDLAALIVERVTDQPFESWLRDRFFEPLGMSSSFVRPGRFSDWPGVRTLSYRRAGDSLLVHDVWDREGFHGGSNVYMAAGDIHRWASSFVTRPVLDDTTLALGLAAVALNDGSETGIDLLGWYESPDGSAHFYPGVLQGFYAGAYWDSDTGIAIGFVSNSDMPNWLRPLLTSSVVSILETGSTEELTEPARLPLGDDPAESISGTYDIAGVGRVAISADDGNPYVRVDAGPRYRMFPVDSTTAYAPGLDAWVSFGEGFRTIRWATTFVNVEGRRH